MEKVKIWPIERPLPFNPGSRYSIIESKTGHYLVDHDRDLRRHFLPVFHCVIPEKVMKISMPKFKVDGLLLDKRKTQKLNEDAAFKSGIGLLISKTLGPVLIIPILTALIFDVPNFIYFFVVFLIMMSVVVVRIKLSKRAKQLLDFIGEENLSETKMWIVPAGIFQVIKSLFIIIFGLFFTIMMFVFLETDEVLMILLAFILGTAVLFMFSNLHGLLMQNVNYRIKILDQ